MWFSLHWPGPQTSIWILQYCNAGYVWPNRKITAIDISPDIWQFLPNTTTSYCFLWCLLLSIIPGQSYGNYLPHFGRDENFNWLFLVQNWCGYVFHATLRSDRHYYLEVILNIFWLRISGNGKLWMVNRSLNRQQIPEMIDAQGLYMQRILDLAVEFTQIIHRNAL